MVGGPQWAYDEFESVFDAVATGPDGHERMGPAGSGHYVKMVHNGVEYALMQTYGEGFELLHEGRYDLDLENVASVWNNGAVIRSWLLELCEEAFREEESTSGRSPIASKAARPAPGPSRRDSNRRSPAADLHRAGRTVRLAGRRRPVLAATGEPTPVRLWPPRGPETELTVC